MGNPYEMGISTYSPQVDEFIPTICTVLKAYNLFTFGQNGACQILAVGDPPAEMILGPFVWASQRILRVFFRWFPGW